MKSYLKAVNVNGEIQISMCSPDDVGISSDKTIIGFMDKASAMELRNELDMLILEMN